MRILVLSEIPPAAIGGAEIQARQLALHWAKAGHAVTVAGYGNRSCIDGSLTVVRIPTLRQARWLRAASYLVATLFLLWRRRRQYDLIYCRFLKEQAIVAALAKIAFRLRQPLVACPESASIHGDVHELSCSRLRMLSLRVLRGGLSAVIAISSRIAREIETLDLGVPTVRIPNGVAIPPAGSCERSVESGALRVLFVGRLVDVKGLDILLRSIALLRGRELKLRLVGDGPMRATLEADVLRRGLDDCVEFAGALAPEQVSAAYLGADLFVLPSRYEGLPVALLEASVHGLPAIATRVSGSEDIVDGRTGWLVPADDPVALAAALDAAISFDREELRAMGRRAREKIVSDYDIEKVSGAYLRLFDDLVGRRADAGGALEAETQRRSDR